MFKNIYIPVDNSDYSNACVDLALDLAKGSDTTITASHVYAAKMHDVRFRQMESGLPEEYQDEQELERQRNIHDQLITKGMEVISDSYLDVPKEKCKELQIPFVGKSLEGRNWTELVRDIKESPYDLVVMGALGLGAIKDSLIGTVAERVIRRSQKDILLVKHCPDIHEDRPSSGKIVVAVDGSGHSFGGLKTGIELAKKLNRPLEVISTFDPYFHYAMFNSLTGVLSREASKVFKFEQQEKLHEDIIDKGLAKIYQAHLEISRKVCEEENIECTIRLLDGKVFEKVLQYAREENPYLMILGRIGVHSAADMDIGGNTENLMRLVPCNLLLSSKVFKPSIDMQAEESIEWTSEAKVRLTKIPGFVRPMATSAILRYALERGHSMITSSVITEAVQEILPAGAMQAMSAIGDKMKAGGMDPNNPEGLGMLKEEMAEAHAGKAPEEITLKCTSCNTYHKGDVVKCSVCDAGAERLLPVDKAEFKATDTEAQDSTTFTTLPDGVEVSWTQEALDRLNEFPQGHLRRKAHARVEKNARVQKVNTVSLAFLNKILNEKISKGDSGDSKSIPGDIREIGAALSPDDFTWSPEALERLERVPQGFMRDNTQNRVMAWCSQNDIQDISLEVCEEGIRESVKMMEEAMKSGAALEDFLPQKEVKA
ncbi:MAG: universal stress protein [Nitrospina sp.]|nr:universal stress protein [Nitrospina sp.]MBT3414065.1 universal stress protein [Nitrospina sp.]MBT4388947.1 universal stress protein [Nitrospina sp.]MBT4620340.1 universal stress protein [Nitrospina sp.]MBT5958987.1 universal stress protein [Nitrospina sp.]